MSRLGNTSPTIRSPLPQEGASKNVQPVRIVDGFSATLPPRSRTFFQRIYFAPMPRPIVKAPGNSFPFPVPICRIKAPERQVVVIRAAFVGVYASTGISPEDIAVVPPARVVSYFGFSFKIGQRGLTDFNTNSVQSLGGPASVLVSSSGQGADDLASAGLSPGAGQVYPFSGRLTPPEDENFAAYARPGDEISITAFVLRPPQYDARLFSAQISGWLSGESELDKIIDSISA